MTTNIGNNPNTPPIGAFGINSSNGKLEAGHIVVCPPKTVYKYSMYDELDLGKDRFKELMLAIEPREAARERNVSKTTQFLGKVINWGLAIGVTILAIKHRVPLKNFFANIISKVKNSVK